MRAAMAMITGSTKTSAIEEWKLNKATFEALALARRLGQSRLDQETSELKV